MPNRILKNHWCQLLTGNLSVALVAFGIPVAVVFTITGTLATVTAEAIILAIAHLSLVGLQISRGGTWIPEKWMAVGYVFLLLIDVWRTVDWFSRGFSAQGLCALVMAVVASFVTVFIVQNQWRKWREPKNVVAMVRRSISNDNAALDHPEDPTTMVF